MLDSKSNLLGMGKEKYIYTKKKQPLKNFILKRKILGKFDVFIQFFSRIGKTQKIHSY